MDVRQSVHNPSILIIRNNESLNLCYVRVLCVNVRWAAPHGTAIAADYRDY